MLDCGKGVEIKMKKRLYLKFILAYFIFGIFSLITVTTFVPSMTLEGEKRDKAESFYEVAFVIAEYYASGLYTNETSLEKVQEEINIISLYIDANIMIINPSGLRILDSSEILDIYEDEVVVGFDPSLLSGNYYFVNDFFEMFDEDMLSVIAPITADYKIRGYVVIQTPLEKIIESTGNVNSIFYIAACILFLLSLIILIFFTHIVYFPLQKITYATEQYAAGNMHYEIHIDSEDEIGYLAACLSYMAKEIAQIEDDQKKFVANVSHDFRSPLTSIQGYLKAILDGTIPVDLHEKYVQIVLTETDRLTKLTNGLLTLNNLNTKGMYLEKKVFDINTVIRDSAYAFEGTCHEKQIGIQLLLSGDILYVNADVEKIKQVLYNLLENAIKFSNHNSVITIETYEKNKKVLVSVKDNGLGIPKEDIKLIWDRFYKSDISRGKDKKGTGLGLSIVKEIINSHNEYINVISTVGVGSEFIFSLESVDEDD